MHFYTFSNPPSLFSLSTFRSLLLEVYHWFPRMRFAYTMPTWLFVLKLNQNLVSGRISWWGIVAFNCVQEPLVNKLFSCLFFKIYSFFLLEQSTESWLHVLLGRTFGHKVPRSATTNRSWDCFCSVGGEQSLFAQLRTFWQESRKMLHLKTFWKTFSPVFMF